MSIVGFVILLSSPVTRAVDDATEEKERRKAKEGHVKGINHRKVL